MISIKNIILPNKPLSNFELEDVVKKLKIPYFRGVFLLDTLPKKPNRKEYGKVNFDKIDSNCQKSNKAGVKCIRI